MVLDGLEVLLITKERFLYLIMLSDSLFGSLKASRLGGNPKNMRILFVTSALIEYGASVMCS